MSANGWVDTVIDRGEAHWKKTGFWYRFRASGALALRMEQWQGFKVVIGKFKLGVIVGWVPRSKISLSSVPEIRKKRTIRAGKSTDTVGLCLDDVTSMAMLCTVTMT